LKALVRVWVYKLWAVCLLQEATETLTRGWLVIMFRSEYMCRVSLRNDKWCMVPSLTQTMMHRLPSWNCVYDPWCNALVYKETTPPLITRLSILGLALTVSLLVAWSPRILTYRPSHPLLLLARVSWKSFGLY
ncbi:hypothetical protein Hamer_G012613, partial [Homarus americanus]